MPRLTEAEREKLSRKFGVYSQNLGREQERSENEARQAACLERHKKNIEAMKQPGGCIPQKQPRGPAYNP